MTTPPRRLLGISAGVSILLSALLLASPSSAASHSGDLVIKGPGTLYSGDGAIVSEAAAVGAAVRFELKVVNTGTTLAQYNIRVVQTGLPATADLYSGSLALTPLSSSPDGYYTSPMAPGKSQAFVLKVTIPAGSAQGSAATHVVLFSTDGHVLGNVLAQTEVKAPTNGTTPTDIFAKQGSQSYVGGSVSAQMSTSPALKVGGSAAFTVKLQNDGPTSTTVRGYAIATLGCAIVTIKDGVTDVTAGVLGDSYATPVLAIHEARTLKVTVTRNAATGCGPHDFITFFAHDIGFANSHYVYLVMPYPAT